jgi:hypothetical protein
MMRKSLVGGRIQEIENIEFEICKALAEYWNDDWGN